MGLPIPAEQEVPSSLTEWNSPAAGALLDTSAFQSELPSVALDSNSPFPQNNARARRRPSSASIDNAQVSSQISESTQRTNSHVGARYSVLIIGFNHNRQVSRMKTMQTLEFLLKTTDQKNLAFEFPSDLQDAFDRYAASAQGTSCQLKFATAMLNRYPPAILLNVRQKADCSRKLLATESINSLLDVATLAKMYGANIVLVVTPMHSVKLSNPRIVYRNQMMAHHLLVGARGRSVILLVGSAHTGHGDLKVSLDDTLTRLGAVTLSVNVSSPDAPYRRDWGTNYETSDYQISEPGEIVRLIARKLPGMCHSGREGA